MLLRLADGGEIREVESRSLGAASWVVDLFVGWRCKAWGHYLRLVFVSALRLNPDRTCSDFLSAT